MDISEFTEREHRVSLAIGPLIPLDRFRVVLAFPIEKSVSEPPGQRDLGPFKPRISRAPQIVDRLRGVSRQAAPPGFDAVCKLRHGDEFAAIRGLAQEIDGLNGIVRAKFATHIPGSSKPIAYGSPAA